MDAADFQSTASTSKKKPTADEEKYMTNLLVSLSKISLALVKRPPVDGEAPGQSINQSKFFL